MAADVWGLGITVLELFLGRCAILGLPYDSGMLHSVQKLEEAICHREPPSVPEDAEASAELRGFVVACLQKKPGQRATVAQLLSHPFITGRDVTASRLALRDLIVDNVRFQQTCSTFDVNGIVLVQVKSVEFYMCAAQEP
ncbi:hypothetical protein U9M48_014117 [Paspalum notatum var. saurae]|uniref:Protein kinase domain-containing protein n=1 Tax=Paspalum notatum var. saurae TaxID=547442 RepID=A0AAQ3T0X8_PASNO